MFHNRPRVRIPSPRRNPVPTEARNKLHADEETPRHPTPAQPENIRRGAGGNPHHRGRRPGLQDAARGGGDRRSTGRAHRTLRLRGVQRQCHAELGRSGRQLYHGLPGAETLPGRQRVRGRRGRSRVRRDRRRHRLRRDNLHRRVRYAQNPVCLPREGHQPGGNQRAVSLSQRRDARRAHTAGRAHGARSLIGSTRQCDVDLERPCGQQDRELSDPSSLPRRDGVRGW